MSRALLLSLTCLAGVLCVLRWLRVAQREHYLPGSALRFAWRWWGRNAFDVAIFSAGAASAVASFDAPTSSVVTALIVGLGPRGLGIRGRTGRLVWTRRLSRLAFVTVVIGAIPIALAGLFASDGAVGAAAVVVLVLPAIVDLAMLILVPLEDILISGYVKRASIRVGQVAPRIVAITGSYGKTTTKVYVAHLLAGQYAVVASPRSFNNRAGLARAVNEQVGLGTEIFVAEMGAYGPGEIASLCRWLPPEVAAITAIGPVHLERFKSLDRTLRAKAEITEKARTVVLNVDDERLALLANELEGTKRVVRCSSSRIDVDVAAIEGREGTVIYRDGVEIGSMTGPAGAPTNVAVACAIAFVFGCSEESVISRLSTLPSPEHRLTPSASDDGVLILDDTFNANPAGTRRALSTLAKSAEPNARRVVVTPGMVELGALQDEENAAFAAQAAEIASDVVVVNATNRRALLSGLERQARAGNVRVVTVARRGDAVAWVRGTLGPGDVVLYENDLPDHYP